MRCQDCVYLFLVAQTIGVFIQMHTGRIAVKDGDDIPASATTALDFILSKPTTKATSKKSSFSIFVVPKPFIGDDDRRQRLAIESWLELAPSLKKIVFLGNDEGYDKAVADYNGTKDVIMTIDEEIDTNFLGLPLFNSMLLRSQAADTDVAVLINGDICLLPDFVEGIDKFQSRFDKWFSVVARYDINDKDNVLKYLDVEEKKRWVKDKGTLHTYGGVDTFIFNVPQEPIIEGPMPHFVFGRGKYDNWLVHEAEAAGYRNVIDASEAITTYHRTHTYKHVDESENLPSKDNYWSRAKRSSWELFVNINLAESHGSYTNQDGRSTHTKWKLSSCYDDDDSQANMCLLRRQRPGVCSCEHSNFASKTQTDPKLNPKTNQWICGAKSTDKVSDYTIPTLPQQIQDPKPGLPHLSHQLLERVAIDKTIVFTAASYNYRGILMSFICNLKKLGITNYVIAALDEEMYRYAYVRGIPVYYENFDGLLSEEEQRKMEGKFGTKGCAFGTQCFRAMTKLKSRAVLRILRLGYNVLWSDSDIVWFQNPIPMLLGQREQVLKEIGGDSVLQIQSNEPDINTKSNGHRRINSGFYLAMADPKTIHYFDAIIQEASTTSLSEQPSFYDILCGFNGEFVKGDNACLTDGMATHFLDRNLYANGAAKNIWNSTNIVAEHPDLVILHNNWISGEEEKLARQRKNGFYHYNVDHDICDWSWLDRLPKPTRSKPTI